MNPLVQDCIAALESFKDDHRLRFAKTSYPTELKLIGVTVPNVKIVLKALKAQTKSFSAREKILLAKDLVRTSIFECHHLAFEYLGKDNKALKALTEQDLDDLAKGLDNWVLVDTYSGYLVGYAWREGIISTEKIKSFLLSEDFWQRRVAIVATISLNQKARGGTGDPNRTLEICEMVIHDHHDMINKALSWALRELVKVDKKVVEEFIQKNFDHLHPRVRREVRKKLDTGKKT